MRFSFLVGYSLERRRDNNKQSIPNLFEVDNDSYEASSKSSRVLRQQQDANHNYNERPSSEGTRRMGVESDSLAKDQIWPQDLYEDFDALYESMCKNKAMEEEEIGKRRKNHCGDCDLRVIVHNDNVNNNDHNDRPNKTSLYHHKHNNDPFERLATTSSSLANFMDPSSIPSPRSPSDFGCLSKPLDGAHSPTSGRADSRDTYQSLRDVGPALVEEMTLTDLEDEISSSLIANEEAQRRAHGRHQKNDRNRSSKRETKVANNILLNHHDTNANHTTPTQMFHQHHNPNPNPNHDIYRETHNELQADSSSLVNSQSAEFFSQMLKNDLTRYYRRFNPR